MRSLRNCSSPKLAFNSPNQQAKLASVLFGSYNNCLRAKRCAVTACVASIGGWPSAAAGACGGAARGGRWEASSVTRSQHNLPTLRIRAWTERQRGRSYYRNRRTEALRSRATVLSRKWSLIIRISKSNLRLFFLSIGCFASEPNAVSRSAIAMVGGQAKQPDVISKICVNPTPIRC